MWHYTKATPEDVQGVSRHRDLEPVQVIVCHPVPWGTPEPGHTPTTSLSPCLPEDFFDMCKIYPKMARITLNYGCIIFSPILVAFLQEALL